jgi:hypothetical protein
MSKNVILTVKDENNKVVYKGRVWGDLGVFFRRNPHLASGSNKVFVR